MKWDEINWTESKSTNGSGVGRSMQGLVSISTNKCGNDKFACRLAIPAEAMRAMSWQRGDRLRVLFAYSENLIALVRTNGNEARCTIMSNNKNSKKGNTSGYIQFSVNTQKDLSFIPKEHRRCGWKPEDKGLIVNISPII